jgi:hypothetical protein
MLKNVYAFVFIMLSLLQLLIDYFAVEAYRKYRNIEDSVATSIKFSEKVMEYNENVLGYNKTVVAHEKLQVQKPKY